MKPNFVMKINLADFIVMNERESKLVWRYDSLSYSVTEDTGIAKH